MGKIHIITTQRAQLAAYFEICKSSQENSWKTISSKKFLFFIENIISNTMRKYHYVWVSFLNFERGPGVPLLNFVGWGVGGGVGVLEFTF